jgi:hypothetical protein
VGERSEKRKRFIRRQGGPRSSFSRNFYPKIEVEKVEKLTVMTHLDAQKLRQN